MWGKFGILAVPDGFIRPILIDNSNVCWKSWTVYHKGSSCIWVRATGCSIAIETTWEGIYQGFDRDSCYH